GAAALLVDDVERADDPDVILEVGEVARASAAIEVGHECGPADRTENEVSIAEYEVALWVPGEQFEPRRRESDELGDLRRLEADARGRATTGGVARPLDPGTCPFEQVDRSPAQDLDADVAQDPQSRVMNRLDLV